MNATVDPIRPAQQFASLIDSVLRRFEQAGYERQPHHHIQPPKDDGTLFVSGGIQNWRSWVLQPTPGQARAGAQWCVRTNQLTELDSGRGNATSFCMMSAVRQGHSDRSRTLEDTISAVESVGIAANRLGFIVSGDDGNGRTDDTSTKHALAELGVADSRISVRPRRWSHPFRPVGPAGPNLFVLAEIAEPCSEACTPQCTCGRFKHICNCEFLEYERSQEGTLRSARVPVTDIAGSAEWLACAAASKQSIWSTRPFDSAAHSVRDLLALSAASERVSDPKLELLLDHGRTVALLLGSGIDASPQGAGHVLRRLFRRMLAVLAVHDIPLDLAQQIVAASIAFSSDCHGFPSSAAISAQRPQLCREIERFQTVLSRGQACHKRAVTRAANPRDLAHEMFRIKSNHGVPISVLVAWCEKDGRAVSMEELGAMVIDERNTSRSTQPPKGDN